MTLAEAMAIAYDGEHAATTFDLAARVIRDEGHGRDQMAYGQLAELKAERQRAKGEAQRLWSRNAHK